MKKIHLQVFVSVNSTLCDIMGHVALPTYHTNGALAHIYTTLRVCIFVCVCVCVCFVYVVSFLLGVRSSCQIATNMHDALCHLAMFSHHNSYFTPWPSYKMHLVSSCPCLLVLRPFLLGIKRIHTLL